VMHVSHDVFGAVTPGIFSVRMNPAMFSNMDKHPILSRGMGVAIAKKSEMSDEIFVTRIRHTIGGKSKAEMFSCVPKRQTYRANTKGIVAEVKERYWLECVFCFEPATFNMEAEMPVSGNRPPPGSAAKKSKRDLSKDNHRK